MHGDAAGRARPVLVGRHDPYLAERLESVLERSQTGGRDAVVVGEDDQRAARLEVDEGTVPFGGHRGDGLSRS